MFTDLLNNMESSTMRTGFESEGQRSRRNVQSSQIPAADC